MLDPLVSIHPTHRHGGSFLFMKGSSDKPRKVRKPNLDDGLGKYPAWWNSENGDFGIVSVARKPDEWEAFVRRWKIRHGPKTEHPLSEAQHKSADAILKSCRQRAQNILDKHKDVAEREVAETKIARIFDDLKSRLNRLLTTTQSEEDKGEVTASGKYRVRACKPCPWRAPIEQRVHRFETADYAEAK